MSIFIDYCPAAAIQRKVKERGRDTGLITRMRLAAVWPGATWTLMACAGRKALTRVPLPPPPHRIMDRFWQPGPKSRMAFIFESVIGSDRTLRSRDRSFEFSQEMVKICAAARNLDTHVVRHRLGPEWNA